MNDFSCDIAGIFGSQKNIGRSHFGRLSSTFSKGYLSRMLKGHQKLLLQGSPDRSRGNSIDKNFFFSKIICQ
jgi:hypothetical protein